MIDALPTFVAVATAGSFSQVARDQGVAVSSVTRRIDLLEAELNTRLFTRSSRQLRLTDAGEHLLPRAQRILGEVADARDGLASLYADPRGTLTVTAPSMFGRQHLAGAVQSFLGQYPLLDVDLHLSDQVIDLGERRVDVAIRIGRIESSELVAAQLAPIRRILCASPAYLERAGVPNRPEDLLKHACLTVSTTRAPHGWWCFEGVNRGLALNVKGRLRSDDTGVLLQAAVDGLGIVHLASWLVGEMLADGRLVQILPDARPPAGLDSAIHAVRLPGRSDSAKARLFVAHLRKSFGNPPYWEKALGVGSSQRPGLA
jgi:DNA-binding transcriptional LysR family regulator